MGGNFRRLNGKSFSFGDCPSRFVPLRRKSRARSVRSLPHQLSVEELYRKHSAMAQRNHAYGYQILWTSGAEERTLSSPMGNARCPGHETNCRCHMGASEWRRLLAQPDIHWKRGASAFETAVAWEKAAKGERGLPPEAAAAIDGEPALAGASVLFALPEHKVKLAAGGHRRPTYGRCCGRRRDMRRSPSSFEGRPR